MRATGGARGIIIEKTRATEKVVETLAALVESLGKRPIQAIIGTGLLILVQQGEGLQVHLLAANCLKQLVELIGRFGHGNGHLKLFGGVERDVEHVEEARDIDETRIVVAEHLRNVVDKGTRAARG